MKNREIYLKDPIDYQLQNNGVAKVNDEINELALKSLRYELDTFVCEGEYQKGLDKILHTFLKKLDASGEQPGVWISGFYGSGKSHLAKMLRSLWVDYKFSDGSSARAIAKLPTDIMDLLSELTNKSKQHGGLHAASGEIEACENNVSLALLRIVFKSVGLPDKYHLARFVMWLKAEGHYEGVKAAVESKGRVFLHDFYISTVMASSLLAVMPDLGSNESDVLQMLRAEYPAVEQITNNEMTEAITQALTVNGKFPLTLIVLDEIQQFIGTDANRAFQVHEVTETCSSRFGSKLLFVGTGQNALSGMASLNKLMGRFTVPVQLSDVDVESVIRKIILQKKETAKPDVQAVITKNLGEISRHLEGTKIVHNTADETIMVMDYPILPVRRRFWEKVLRIIDTTGTVAQLRNQLKVIHEATQSSADKPLGHVIGADFIYGQISSNLLQTGMISREISEKIDILGAGTKDEQLQSRLIALIYLIGKLPTEANADIGVRATEHILADLLVEDLNVGSNELRQQIPALLTQLQNQGLLMALDTANGVEYRLQTQESSQWYDTYRQQEADLSGNAQRAENKREDLLHHKINEIISTVRVTQGQSKELRTLQLNYDNELPKDAHKKIYIWVQDGWNVDEKSMLAEALNVSQELPTIYVYIPARNKSELYKAIITKEAAQATLDIRGMPTTSEGQDARRAMETRRNDADRQVDSLFKDIIAGVKVFQAGGTEITGNNLKAQIEQAAQASIIRLYRDFDKADFTAWGSVYDKARKDGAENALEAVNYKGDIQNHPVCAEIIRYIGVSKKGADIRDNFKAPPYGWSQDAIDSALLVLLACGVVRAKDAAQQPLDNKTLERSKLTQASFYLESVTISAVQLIQIRRLIIEVGITCNPQEELSKVPEFILKVRQLAESAGGEAPKPSKVEMTLFDSITQESGNAQLLALYEKREIIKEHLKAWQEAAEKITNRLPAWSTLKQLLQLSKDLAFYDELKTQMDAVINNRSLLSDPDPVEALTKDLSARLRNAVTVKSNEFNTEYQVLNEQLAENDNWQEVTDIQQQQILDSYDINEPIMVSVNTVEELIDSLEVCSIKHWNDRIQAQNNKFNSATLDAAKLLEPKVQQVKLPHRTLKTEADIKAWLAEVEQLMLKDLQNGPLVV